MLRGKLMLILVVVLATVPSSLSFLNLLNNLFKRNCKFECPNELKVASNPDHYIIRNGCGDFIPFNLVDIFANSAHNWTKCCDGVTRCYQQCGYNKTICDNGFRSCLKAMTKINSEAADVQLASFPGLTGQSLTSYLIEKLEEEENTGPEQEGEPSDNDCSIFEWYHSQACICK